MNNITKILITLGCIYLIPSFAQVDYSKIKTQKQYVYEGDVSSRSNSYDTSDSSNEYISARDKSKAKIKSIKDKELAKERELLEAEQRFYHFQSNQKPSNRKFDGYNQLISNKDDYKYTKFDANYFNSSKNPFELQKNGKYQNLFNNPDQSRFCWDQAGAYYGLDPWLLFAVAKVESSFRSSAINRNNDKAQSADYGLMQINTFWLPTLAEHGIKKDHLFDPCTSIFVGAWIMKANINKWGYNIDGIGAYNSPHNLQIRRNYGNKVIKAYHEVTRDFGYTN